MRRCSGFLSRRTPTVLGLSLAALVAGACGDATTDPGGGGPRPVAHVAVLPSAARLLPGETLQLRAVARAADDSELTGRTVGWQSFNTSVATVSTTGLLTAMSSGNAVVRATIEGVSANVTVQVAEVNAVPAVSSVSPDVVETTTPVAVLTVAGTGFAVGAVILWDGTPRPAEYIGPTELRLVPGPSDLRVPGTRTLAVRNPAPGGGTSGTVSLTIAVGVSSVVVTPTELTLSVGQSATLEAKALDANGMELLGRTFTFTSSSPGAVTVNATGVVTARNVGPAIITAASGGRSADVSVTVVAPVQFVWVTPNPAAVLLGSSTQLTARTFTHGMVEVMGRTVTWSSANADIATVDATGRVVGVATGATRIRAESEGVVTWVDLDVRQWTSVSTLALRGFTETLVWPNVGTTTWVDEQGNSHPATQTLSGGTLTMRFDTGRWQRTYDIRIYIGSTLVGTETWTDEGTFGYTFGSGALWFTSDATGQTVTGTDAAPGEIRIRQGVGTSPPLTQRWIVQ